MSWSRFPRTPNRAVVNRRPQIEHIMHVGSSSGLISIIVMTLFDILQYAMRDAVQYVSAMSIICNSTKLVSHFFRPICHVKYCIILFHACFSLSTYERMATASSMQKLVLSMTLNCRLRVIYLQHPGVYDLSCWSAVKQQLTHSMQNVANNALSDCYYRIVRVRWHISLEAKKPLERANDRNQVTPLNASGQRRTVGRQSAPPSQPLERDHFRSQQQPSWPDDKCRKPYYQPEGKWHCNQCRAKTACANAKQVTDRMVWRPMVWFRFNKTA